MASKYRNQLFSEWKTCFVIRYSIVRQDNVSSAASSVRKFAGLLLSSPGFAKIFAFSREISVLIYARCRFRREQNFGCYCFCDLEN